MAKNNTAVETRVRTGSVSDLIQDDRNANRGTNRGHALVMRSIKTCGAGRSILIDKNGKIIAGNKTAENACKAGLSEVEVIQSDGSKLIAVQRTDLDLDTDPVARELALYDNRTSEVGLDWDMEIIEAFKDEGLDIAGIFENDAAFGLSVEDETALSSPDDFDSVDENLETIYQCPKCGYEWSGQPK